MSVSAILQLATAVQANVPAIWWGKPGVGKTAILSDLGDSLGFDSTIVISLATRAPEDIGGLPVPSKTNPDLCHRLYEGWAVAAHNGPCLIVLDEFNRTQRATMNGALRLVQERMAGDLSMHPGTRFVMTGNPSNIDSGAADCPSAAANRMLHVNDEADFDQWTNWMLGGGGAINGAVKLPTNWEADYLPMARRDVVGFLNVKRNLESVFPKDLTQQGGPWPSRRSWTNAAQLWAAGGLALKSIDLGIKLVAGVVGEGPAMEFVSYVKDADLPDPKDILADPSRFTLPRRMDQHFAVLGSVCALARQIHTPAAMVAAEEVLVRAAEQGARDTASASLGLLMSGNPKPLPVGWTISPRAAQAFMPTLQAAGWVGGRK